MHLFKFYCVFYLKKPSIAGKNNITIIPAIQIEAVVVIIHLVIFKNNKLLSQKIGKAASTVRFHNRIIILFYERELVVDKLVLFVVPAVELSDFFANLF